MAYQSYSYSGPSYNPPPQQSAYYNPPGPRSYQPPAPSPAPPALAGSYDPFRAYYADRLRELTFNSRPLIQELSVLAMQQRDQNHWGNMTAVVEEIEGAVYRSPPHEKLPKLYLLDSISKNVGPPYTTHLLQQTIPRLYIRTHREVDGVTKVKMEEMISLWRRSGPNGEELYGPAAREAVEREIFGASAANALGGGREIITRDSVLGAIHSTIAVKQGEASQRPWDRGVQTQLTALMGLSEMLNTRIVQPGELQQIMDQLQGMGYASPAVPPNQTGYNQPQRSPMPPFPPTPVPHQPPAVQTYPPNNAVNLPPFAPTLQQHYDAPTATPPYPTSTPVLQVSTPLPAPIPTAAPAAPLFDANMLSILSSLTGAGGIANAGIRTPDLAVVQPKVRTKLDDYEDMVLSLNLSLSNLDMNRMTALPLEHLPIQCSQCSARFPSEGDQLNAHMDWHARRNKSERNASGRGAHRRWLPRAEEWVNDIPVAGSSTAPDTIAGTTGTDGNDSVGTGATANTTSIKAPKSAEELQRKWVRVPTVPGAAAAVCPVCKDGFKREWSEKEEEWVWRNAIDINGKIMHATCRQQQLTANRLARVGKGRSGSAGTKSISKSPGMTPEPLIGVKVEPHPLSHSIASTAADLSQCQTDLVAVTTGGEGEESGGMGKRKADEEAEEERKRVKMEPTETGEQNVSESAVVEEVVGGQGVVASVV